ncbi:hypothetical protein C1646_662448 [Rhizophagus diaphanus]|nr:hypothetical protein C1646_662448 [Rhizophagus diaphanus] [Rhizophagus sp. MUCL 43196]
MSLQVMNDHVTKISETVCSEKILPKVNAPIIPLPDEVSIPQISQSNKSMPVIPYDAHTPYINVALKNILIYHYTIVINVMMGMNLRVQAHVQGVRMSIVKGSTSWYKDVKKLEDIVNRDGLKRCICQDNGTFLLEVWYDQKSDIVILERIQKIKESYKVFKRKEKKLPAVVNIFAIPSNLSKSEKKDKEDLELLNLFISFLSSVQIYNGRTNSEWPNISKPEEVVDYMKLKGQTLFDLITKKKLLAMILPKESHAGVHFEDTTTIVDIHISILEKLFKSLRFPPSTINELDTILSLLVSKLNSLKLDWRETKQNPTFCFNTFYFDSDGAKLRAYYLVIDNESWSIFIEKVSAKQERFIMDYFDFVFTFNKNAMNKNRDFINETIDKITGYSRSEIEDILKPEYVNLATDVLVEEDK